MAGNPDGPLTFSLRRYADREPRVWVQRWKRDHPVTLSLTLEEFAFLCAGKGLVDEQVRIASRSESQQGSTLELGPLLEQAGVPTP